MRWKITYKIADNVTVEAPHDGYDAHGIKLVCEAGQLQEVEHILEVDDSDSGDEILLASREQLRFFWEFVAFSRLLPPRIASYHREKLDRADGEPRVRTGSIVGESGYSVARPVVFPPEETLNRLSSDERLVRWLGWANRARRVGGDDAEAILPLYFVCEDWKRHRPHVVNTQLVRELKHVRDFVSHARLDKNKAALAFLEQQLGGLRNRYEPTNPKDAILVRDYRERAQRYIDAELSAMF